MNKKKAYSRQSKEYFLLALSTQQGTQVKILGNILTYAVTVGLVVMAVAK